jgi:hypothetical protein
MVGNLVNAVVGHFRDHDSVSGCVSAGRSENGPYVEPRGHTPLVTPLMSPIVRLQARGE